MSWKQQTLNGKAVKWGGVKECKGEDECKEEAIRDLRDGSITLYVTIHSHGKSSTVPLRFQRKDNFMKARV